MRHTLILAAGLAVMAAGFVLPAQADNFSAGSLVNVLRAFDVDFTLRTRAAWGPCSHGGAYGDMNAIDSGYAGAQMNGGTPWTDNWGNMDITLPAPTSISSVYTAFGANGGHFPAEYRVVYSTTPDFANPIELVLFTTVSSSGMQTDAFAPTTVQYLRVEFRGSLASQYVIIREIEAYASDPTVIRYTDGYNILADSAIAAYPVLYDSLNRSSGWLDNPNNAVDQNSNTYLRSLGDSRAAGEQFFVKQLGDSYSLGGFAYAYYPEQSWGAGMVIQMTNEQEITEFTQWITVYENDGVMSGSGASVFEKYADGIDARFIRISTPDGTKAGGALSELEFFAPVVIVPEPATMTLLALGGVAFLRRRTR